MVGSELCSGRAIRAVKGSEPLRMTVRRGRRRGDEEVYGVVAIGPGPVATRVIECRADVTSCSVRIQTDDDDHKPSHHRCDYLLPVIPSAAPPASAPPCFPWGASEKAKNVPSPREENASRHSFGGSRGFLPGRHRSSPRSLLPTPRGLSRGG